MKRKQIKDNDLSLSAIRAMTVAPTTPVTTPDGGVYVLDSTDTTSADNTGLVLVTATGQRMKRQVPDKRITPQMFGALGNGIADDSAALTAWLNANGSWQLYIPKGRYKTTTALTRINKGSCRIEGAGPGQAVIEFAADTDGLTIANGLNQTYGSIVINNISINSVGAKTGGNKQALVLTAQHEQKPGISLNNVSVFSYEATHQWGVCLNLTDCSATNIDGLDIQGVNYTTTTAVKLYTATNRPSVEHNWNNVHIRAVKYGFDIFSDGSPGVEGLQLSNIFAVGSFQAFKAVSTAYNAPHLFFNNVHFSSFGGEAVYIDGYGQISFNSTCLFYSSKDTATNVTPTRAVYIKNALAVLGGFVVNTPDQTPNQVDVDGGIGCVFTVIGIVKWGETNLVRIRGGNENSKPDVTRIWGGSGTLSGQPVKDESLCLVGLNLLSSPKPVEGQVAVFKNGVWQAGNPDTSRIVQGTNARSRGTNITAITASLVSGFYTYTNQSNDGFPSDSTNVPIWFVTVNRYEAGAGNDSLWSAITITNLKSKKSYVGGWDEQIGGLVPWKPITQ